MIKDPEKGCIPCWENATKMHKGIRKMGSVEKLLFVPAQKLKVVEDTDICVIGGSCTGVFAAVRAARLGARVVLIEKQNCLGGVATCGLVNVWHSLRDTDGRHQIIAGLTQEVLERLKRQDAVYEDPSPHTAYTFNSEELKIELDQLVKENRIKLYLHTYYGGVLTEGSSITAVILQNKDGRQAIKTSFVIDATGDGDIARDLGLEGYTHDGVQPPSACFLMNGQIKRQDLHRLVTEHGHEAGLPDDWGWSRSVVGCPDLSMRADNHVFNVLCSRAEDLTHSEVEGRRQMRAFVTLLKKYGYPDQKYALVAACSSIGIRETLHYKTRYGAIERELLSGKAFSDPVLYGSYRVDIHHSDTMGITFKELNGERTTVFGKNTRIEKGNWRLEEGYEGEAAKYYQLPFESLMVDGVDNFIPAGRMLHADKATFGALRVMVNLNQLGEAAGVAAWLALQSGKAVRELDGRDVTGELKKGGSAL